MTNLILHHYDRSPYAEAIRLALGLKGASWTSVEIPMMGPKPELAPLTGGYRKTPVLQIGADVFCDTSRIIEELENRLDGPKLIPDAANGLTQMLVQWSGSYMFRPAATLALGPVSDALPKEFWEDRKALFGMDPEKMKSFAPHFQDQWRAGAHWVEKTLLDGRDYFFGDAPCYADIIASIPIWFAGSTGNPEVVKIYGELPRLTAWLERVRSIGHGERSEMTAQDALDVAQGATPTAQSLEDANDARGLKVGDSVVVLTEDPGATPVAGSVVSLRANGISIARKDERVGDVVVHFPRAGIVVQKA
jgi:glutathione S-transferase